MGLRYDRDAEAGFQQALGETQNRVEVTCPHPSCERPATAPAPDAGAEITVTRSAALFGDYEKVRCPEEHKVFVHYCETP